MCLFHFLLKIYLFILARERDSERTHTEGGAEGEGETLKQAPTALRRAEPDTGLSISPP